jgi:diguanylate cyclase
VQNDREQALAKAALALMSECNVRPTPENFELFYSYAAADNPAILRILGDMIAAKKPFSPAALADIRARCLPSGRAQHALDSFSATVTNEITSVLGKLDAAGKDAGEYGRALSAAHGELGADQSPTAIRNLLSNLRSATQSMEQRTRALETELKNSSREVGKLKAQLDEVRKESLTDGLTGIANRRAFDHELQRAIADAQAMNDPVTLLMCDIDRFKLFNDTWGHQTGDQVLRLVANCISENVKGRDTAARFGGEEFAVILPQTTLKDGVKLANQVRASVEGKKLVKKSTGDILGRITISIGVAQYAEGETPAELVRRADACLYKAKNFGRNCVIGETDPRFASYQTDAA